MRKLSMTVLLLALTVALSSCGASGPLVKPTACPKVPPLSPNLAKPSDAGTKVRAELFEPSMSASLKQQP